MKKIKLSIPEPCEKKWSNMTDTGVQGCRFCVDCDKQIQNFSHFTDAEIAYFFQKNNGEICGIFSQAQLGRPIQIEPRKTTYFRAAGLILSSFLAPETVKSQSKPPIQLASEHKGNRQNVDNYNQNEPFMTISGSILDETLQTPLANAKVLFAQTGIFTGTDENGQFELNFPKKYLGPGQNTLEITLLGYDKMDVFIPEKAEFEPLSLKVELKPSMIIRAYAVPQLYNSCSGGLVSIARVSSENYVQKIGRKTGVTRFFRKIFRLGH